MSNWQKMPATMIRKVALVQALREAIPEEFGGLYSPEEMPIDDSVLDDNPIEINDQADNVNQKETKHETNDLASQKQLKYIYSLANQKNIDSKTVKQIMQEEFNKNSSKELTKVEASRLIEILQDYEEEVEPEYEVVDVEYEDEDIENEIANMDLTGTPFEK